MTGGKMNGAIRGFLNLLRDRGGNVLPMAAIGMLLTAALVGGGIDMSRAYRVNNRLQSACDSAVLAGRRAVDSGGYTEAARRQAVNFFNVNFDESALQANTTVFTSSTPDNGQTITGTVTTKLDLAVMQLFGFKQFSLSAACSASMGVGNSDVMMVLDTTGSMDYALGSGTRIGALRTAMKNFYTTVNTATTGTNARIRYGFVPFSSTVNVGRLITALDTSYIADSWGIQSRIATKINEVPRIEENDRTDGPKKDYSNKTYGYDSNCGGEVPTTTPWTNYGSESNLGTTSKRNYDYGAQTWTTTVEQPQQRTVYECYWKNGGYRIRTFTQYQNRDSDTDWKWTYKQVIYDVSSFKAFNSVTTNTGSYGGTVSATWNGCIEERGVDFGASPQASPSSTYSFSTTNGITPYGWDLDLDAAPNGIDAASRWGPMWADVSYYRYSYVASSDYGASAGSACPRQSRLFATMTQSEFNAVADGLSPQGGTYLDIGMVWGGRLSSPDGMFQDNVNVAPSNGGKVSRHIIFMTDGDMDPSQQYHSAWGIEYNDHRVTDNGADSTDKARHISRFRAICEAIKAKGIRIWAISFTTGTSTDMQTCASPDSYYNADDAAALNRAFQEIAKQVGELRITQ